MRVVKSMTLPGSTSGARRMEISRHASGGRMTSPLTRGKLSQTRSKRPVYHFSAGMSASHSEQSTSIAGREGATSETNRPVLQSLFVGSFIVWSPNRTREQQPHPRGNFIGHAASSATTLIITLGLFAGRNILPLTASRWRALSRKRRGGKSLLRRRRRRVRL